MIEKKIKLKNFGHISNRVVVSPMCQYSSINGNPSEWHYKHLSSLICSGASMLILESTAINKIGRITQNDLCLFNDKHEKKLRKLIKFLKKIKNIPICLQISHSGRKGSSNLPWVNSGKYLKKNYWKTISSSDLKKDLNSKIPKKANLNDIKKIILDFSNTAKRAFRAGFDGIEIHMAHGYLIHQFLSPICNIRDDKYGGSLENRCRLAVEITEKIKKNLPKDKILGARITGTDHLNGGIDIDEAIYLAKKLENLKLDYLCVSSGGIIPKTNMNPNINAFRINITKKIKKSVKSILIGSTGNLTSLKSVNKYIKKGYIDFIFVGRQFLINPNWLYQKMRIEVIPKQYLKAFNKNFFKRIK